MDITIKVVNFNQTQIINFFLRRYKFYSQKAIFTVFMREKVLLNMQIN